jgi:hypothetical protein
MERSSFTAEAKLTATSAAFTSARVPVTVHVPVSSAVLAGTYLVRQLPPWFENISKRQYKSPKVYVRDSGLLHALLGLTTWNGLSWSDPGGTGMPSTWPC